MGSGLGRAVLEGARSAIEVAELLVDLGHDASSPGRAAGQVAAPYFESLPQQRAQHRRRGGGHALAIMPNIGHVDDLPGAGHAMA